MKRSSFVKYFVVGIGLVLGTRCSTESVVPQLGCSFTFKGSSYSLPISVCGDNDTAGGQVNSSTTVGAGELLVLTKGGATDGIVFTTHAMGTTPIVYNSFNLSGTYTISISGTKWTFSGNLTNDTGDSGAISGSCTCTVTNP